LKKPKQHENKPKPKSQKFQSLVKRKIPEVPVTETTEVPAASQTKVPEVSEVSQAAPAAEVSQAEEVPGVRQAETTPVIAETPRAPWSAPTQHHQTSESLVDRRVHPSHTQR